MHMGTILISQSMKGLLEQFDLGESQIFELPLYDASKVYPGGRVDADRTKTDPRRWFLLHILEKRDALLPEFCVGLHNSTAKLPDKPPHWSINHDVPPELTIDPDAVGAGDLWRDPKASQFLFFSDALKREIKAQKMKARLLSFKRCKSPDG